MIVFHGSSVEVDKPDVSCSKKYLDFGKGFYVTTFRKQAEKWALRKAIRKSGVAIVNVYELLDEFENGIENMDYKYLTLDLIENEPSLFF